MDIVQDGFGFMLTFGDLTWVPFLYGLQGRYLLEHGTSWGYPALAGITLLNCEYVGHLSVLHLGLIDQHPSSSYIIVSQLI